MDAPSYLEYLWWNEDLGCVWCDVCKCYVVRKEKDKPRDVSRKVARHLSDRPIHKLKVSDELLLDGLKCYQKVEEKDLKLVSMTQIPTTKLFYGLKALEGKACPCTDCSTVFVKNTRLNSMYQSHWNSEHPNEVLYKLSKVEKCFVQRPFDTFIVKVDDVEVKQQLLDLLPLSKLLAQQTVEAEEPVTNKTSRPNLVSLLSSVGQTSDSVNV